MTEMNQIGGAPRARAYWFFAIVRSMEAESKVAASYASLTKEKNPDQIVVRAIEISGRHGSALDLGAGALRETQLLLEAGFRVDAVDRDPTTAEIGLTLANPNLNVVDSDIADFPIRQGHYSLIAAINSLPFLSESEALSTIEHIKNGLAPGAVACFSLFGPRDEWASRADMCFFSLSEVSELFSDLECIECTEIERDRTTARGKMKHWHIITGIFKKAQIKK